MTYLIAEVGGNHDGDVKKAQELCRQAKIAGADAVKFQIYKADRLVHPSLPALKQAKGYDYQIDRFKDLELSGKNWRLIIATCEEIKIDFMATCFDIETLSHYEPDMERIKIASGDLTYHGLIKHAASFGKRVILSTGMANFDEIRQAVKVIGNNPYTVMHCVSSYPCPDEFANLDVIRLLQQQYQSVGYSDHTVGLVACFAAVVRQVQVIEKHFTLNNTLDYGDHPLSAMPNEFAELVQFVKRFQVMRGTTKPSAIEIDNAPHFRRGVYSAHDINEGQVISFEDVVVLRPATQTTLQNIVGTKAPRDYLKGDSFDER